MMIDNLTYKVKTVELLQPQWGWKTNKQKVVEKLHLHELLLLNFFKSNTNPTASNKNTLSSIQNMVLYKTTNA